MTFSREAEVNEMETGRVIRWQDVLAFNNDGGVK